MEVYSGFLTNIYSFRHVMVETSLISSILSRIYRMTKRGRPYKSQPEPSEGDALFDHCCTLLSISLDSNSMFIEKLLFFALCGIRFSIGSIFLV